MEASGRSLLCASSTPPTHLEPDKGQGDLCRLLPSLSVAFQTFRLHAFLEIVIFMEVECAGHFGAALDEQKGQKGSKKAPSTIPASKASSWTRLGTQVGFISRLFGHTAGSSNHALYARTPKKKPQRRKAALLAGEASRQGHPRTPNS